MTKYNEKRIVPHTPNQMYELVASVENYPEFLPWCLASRIVEKNDTIMVADLIVGFQVFREKFRSRVSLNSERKTIHVMYEEGPFKHLTNKWEFKKHEKGCEIFFKLDFEFKNIIFQTLMERLFSEAVKKMVAAFENRANKLYTIY